MKGYINVNILDEAASRKELDDINSKVLKNTVNTVPICDKSYMVDQERGAGGWETATARARICGHRVVLNS